MDFEEFSKTVLSELQELRREVGELKALLKPTSTPVVQPTANANANTNASVALPDWLRQVPPDLGKRLQPLLNQSVPQDPRECAQWILEISENVEDFLRYQSDDWPDSAPYLERLGEVQERCGLQRLTPQEGDLLDPRLHLVLQSMPNAQRRDQVARCARPGFTYEGEILRRAEVVVYL